MVELKDDKRSGWRHRTNKAIRLLFEDADVTVVDPRCKPAKEPIETKIGKTGV